jgi:homopolymeric O-antigen transport system permease protein
LSIVSTPEPASGLAEATRMPTEPPRGGFSLPEKPRVVIRPRRSLVSLNLKEVLRYHELLYFLVWRDVRVRYKQTAMGVAWAVLQPLAMMVIFGLFFGKLVGVPSNGVPYPLFAYAGLLPWLFFATAVSMGGNSVLNSANLITKVYFPRLLVPMAALGAPLVDFAVTCVVLALLMVRYGVAPGRGVLMLPVLLLLLVAVALAASLLLSAFSVRYRDVRIVLPFLIQAWFFASPVIYPASLAQGRWRWGWLLTLNPLTGIIEGFRAALFGRQPFDWRALAVAAAVTVALLGCGVVTFRRMERDFADLV